MFLLRLSPIVPFCIINYVIAGSSLSFTNYLISLVGILPGTIAYVFIGTTLSNYLGFHDDGSNSNSNKKSANYIQLISLLVGILLTIAATFLLSYQARKELLKYRTRSEELDFISSPPVNQLLSLSSPLHTLNEENNNNLESSDLGRSISATAAAMVGGTTTTTLGSSSRYSRDDSIDSRSSGTRQSKGSKYSLPRSQKSSSYLTGENGVDPIEEYSVYM